MVELDMFEAICLAVLLMQLGALAAIVYQCLVSINEDERNDEDE